MTCLPADSEAQEAGKVPVARVLLVKRPISKEVGRLHGWRGIIARQKSEASMAERKRVRRNTLERRCLPKMYKRLFQGAPKGIFKMLEAIKKN
jgi:hypothetical protein